MLLIIMHASSFYFCQLHPQNHHHNPNPINKSDYGLYENMQLWMTKPLWPADGEEKNTAEEHFEG